MKRKVLLTLSWLAVAALCICIFHFSAQSAEDSTLQSSALLDFFNRLFGAHFTDFIIRKCAHFCEYTLLGFFAANAFVYTLLQGKGLLYAVILSFLYAVSDEIHQLFVPGRSCQLRDMLIDLSGILLGTALFALLHLLIKRLGEKRKHVQQS